MRILRPVRKPDERVSIPKGAIMSRALDGWRVRHPRVSIPKGAIMRTQPRRHAPRVQSFNSKRCDYELSRGFCTAHL